MPNEIQSKSRAGRPPGRSNVATTQMRRTLGELAREHTEAALETVLTVMREGETDAIRLAAANIILDRGYGRPQAAVEVTSGTSNLMTLDEAQSRTQRAVLAILEAKHNREDD
jgi:hypothetical protein